MALKENTQGRDECFETVDIIKDAIAAFHEATGILAEVCFLLPASSNSKYFKGGTHETAIICVSGRIDAC